MDQLVRDYINERSYYIANRALKILFEYIVSDASDASEFRDVVSKCAIDGNDYTEEIFPSFIQSVLTPKLIVSGLVNILRSLSEEFHPYIRSYMYTAFRRAWFDALKVKRISTVDEAMYTLEYLEACDNAINIIERAVAPGLY